MKDVIEEVVGSDCRQVPLEFGQYEELPVVEFFQGDRVVCVDAELFGTERPRLLEFGGKEEANCTEQLEFAPVDLDYGQKAVQIVHCQWENLLLAPALFTHLQHPHSDDLPHMFFDVVLDAFEVREGDGILVLHSQKIPQHTIIS